MVDSLDGNVLTVAAPIGGATTKVTLAPNVRVQYVVKSNLAAIVPGSWVGRRPTRRRWSWAHT